MVIGLVLQLTGAAALVAGVALLSVPAAVMVAGLVVLALGLVVSDRVERRQARAAAARARW